LKSLGVVWAAKVVLVGRKHSRISTIDNADDADVQWEGVGEGVVMKNWTIVLVVLVSFLFPLGCGGGGEGKQPEDDGNRLCGQTISSDKALSTFELKDDDEHCANLDERDDPPSRVQLFREKCECGRSEALDLSPLSRLGSVKSITVNGRRLDDLNGLQSVRGLEFLNVEGTEVKDLTPLKTLASPRLLEILKISDTSVDDIAVVKDLRGLSQLWASNTKIQDLSPLTSAVRGRVLKYLDVSGSKVTDVTPLGEGVETLNLSKTAIADIGELSAHKIERLGLALTGVKDLSPLIRHLRHKPARLKFLSLIDTPVQDFRPIGQISSLERLDLSGTSITDLRVLDARKNTLGATPKREAILVRKMLLGDLKRLFLRDTKVEDIRPLAAFTNLVELDLSGTLVTDLSPLSVITKGDYAGSPILIKGGMHSLNTLNLSRTAVVDLSPLHGLKKLHNLDLSHTPIKDVSPLLKSGAPWLYTLDLTGTQVSQADLGQLKQRLKHCKIKH